MSVRDVVCVRPGLISARFIVDPGLSGESAPFDLIRELKTAGLLFCVVLKAFCFTGCAADRVYNQSGVSQEIQI